MCCDSRPLLAVFTFTFVFWCHFVSFIVSLTCFSRLKDTFYWWNSRREVLFCNIHPPSSHPVQRHGGCWSLSQQFQGGIPLDSPSQNHKKTFRCDTKCKLICPDCAVVSTLASQQEGPGSNPICVEPTCPPSALWVLRFPPTV